MQEESLSKKEPAEQIERFYTVLEIAQRWRVDPVTVRDVFRSRKGVMQLAAGGPWRIPASLVNEVVKELELKNGTTAPDSSDSPGS